MSVKVTATVKRGYLCSYHCQKCGELNVENGDITAQGSASAAFKATEKTNNAATDSAKKLLDTLYARMRAGVNQREFYDEMNVKGVCSKCGHQQVWKVPAQKETKFEIALYIMAIVCFFGGLICAAVAEDNPMFILGGIVLAVLCGWLAIKMGKDRSKTFRQSVREKVDGELRNITQWNPYPYVMAMDDPVDESDPRSVELRALLDFIKTQK